MWGRGLEMSWEWSWVVPVEWMVIDHRIFGGIISRSPAGITDASCRPAASARRKRPIFSSAELGTREHGSGIAIGMVAIRERAGSGAWLR